MAPLKDFILIDIFDYFVVCSLPGLGVVEADLVVAVEFGRVAMGGVGFREIGNNRNSVRTNQPEVDAEVVGLAAVDDLEQVECKAKSQLLFLSRFISVSLMLSNI